jgi:hypothetical protein
MELLFIGNLVQSSLALGDAASLKIWLIVYCGMYSPVWSKVVVVVMRGLRVGNPWKESICVYSTQYMDVGNATQTQTSGGYLD